MKMRFRMIIVMAWVWICLFTVPADTAVIHVPGDAATIQTGIDLAVAGDTVRVADGVYTGLGNREIRFNGKAITVISENGPETTVIDCEDADLGIRFETGEGADSVFSGFTITRGNHEDAGGIYCFQASPTIENCIITHCRTAMGGGGIHCSDASSPVFRDCWVTYNRSEEAGSGIWLESGSNAAFIRCMISHNNESGSNQIGGGIYSIGSSFILTDSLVSYNCVSYQPDVGDGAGIFIHYDNGVPVTITNTVFYANTAGRVGGAAAAINAEIEFNNCLMAHNRACEEGGAIHLRNCDADILNCTVTDNSAFFIGGLFLEGENADYSIWNSIIYNNSAYEIGSQGYTTVQYSLVRNGYNGEGNISDPPLFVTGAMGDYYLSQTAAGQAEDSPCVDAGDLPAADICFTRPHGEICMDEMTTRTDAVPDTGTVDMGFHYPPDFPYVPEPEPAPDPPASPENWQIESLVEAPGAGSSLDMVLDAGGYPHVAYFTSFHTDLRYMRMDSEGWHHEYIDTAGMVGSGVSMVIQDTGIVHVSYIDIWENRIMYAFRDAAGWHVSPVADNFLPGYQTKIAVDSGGTVYVAYRDDSSQSIACAAGAPDAWVIQWLWDTQSAGFYFDMALDAAGAPAICSSRPSSGNQMELLLSRFIGGDWITQQIPDSQVDDYYSISGTQPSLCFDTLNEPHIAAGKWGYCVRSDDTWTRIDIPAPYNLWDNVHLVLDSQDRPHFSACLLFSLDMYYLHMPGPQSWTITELDSPGWVGRMNAIDLDSAGTPHVVYLDQTHWRINHARKDAPVETGVDLTLSREFFRPGDEFLLEADITHTGEPYSNVPFLVILDVYNTFYWFPGWTQAFDFESLDLTGEPIHKEILRFTWPESNSNATGIIIYGVLMTPYFTDFLGAWDMVMFGWEV